MNVCLLNFGNFKRPVSVHLVNNTTIQVNFPTSPSLSSSSLSLYHDCCNLNSDVYDVSSVTEYEKQSTITEGNTSKAQAWVTEIYVCPSPSFASSSLPFLPSFDSSPLPLSFPPLPLLFFPCIISNQKWRFR